MPSNQQTNDAREIQNSVNEMMILPEEAIKKEKWSNKQMEEAAKSETKLAETKSCILPQSEKTNT